MDEAIQGICRKHELRNQTHKALQKLQVILVFLLFFSSNDGKAQERDTTFFQLHYDIVDSQESEKIRLWLEEGRKELLAFFENDFKKPFDVYLFSQRDSLDKQWQKDWNMPGFKSQCWMVASGIAHRMDILSPRVWSEQACEHDSRDTLATRNLIIHEMIHVFHGQQNPSPTFENIDNIDWFVEGIAVYASGQLDQERYRDARTFLSEQERPTALSEVWKGQHRYGLAGSLVSYIDKEYGRAAINHLLGLTTATQMLDFLSITEEELIREWKSHVRSAETLLNKN